MAAMIPEWSPRIGWADVPRHVQAGIEHILGAPVEESTGQRGGFSPGTAERVRTASGRRAFVKAVHPSLNAASPAIHRREAAIAAELPRSLPVPALLGTFDDGDWIALVLTDVDGHHPQVPWLSRELELVLDALLELSLAPVPEALSFLPALEIELATDFGGWGRLRVDPPHDAVPWVLENLGQLEALAASGLRALAGNSLVHLDVRSDNILLTADGTAVLVDWPWASRGCGWFDALTVLVNVRTFDPAFDVDSVLGSHRVFAGASDHDINGVLAGLGAYFLDVARTPSPPGLTTVRRFQQQQGEAVVGWLRQRLRAGSGQPGRPASVREASAFNLS